MEQRQRTARRLREAGYPLAPEGKPRAPTHTLKERALRGVKAQNLLLFFTRAIED